MRQVLLLAFLLVFSVPAVAAGPVAKSYGDDPKQVLDIYAAGKACAPEGCPVVVFVHGGGWRNGSNHMPNVRNFGETWSGLGAVVVTLDYRLTPQVQHPAHVQDVAAGTAWVIKNIAAYGGNPHKVYLIGHSAGAHLVALVGTAPEYLKAQGIDLATAIAGVMPIDTASFDLLGVNEPMVDDMIKDAFGDDPAVLTAASPLRILKAGQGYPPFLIAATAQRRPAVEQSRALAKALPEGKFIRVDYDGLSPLKAHGQINRDLCDVDHKMTMMLLQFVGLVP